MPDAGATWAGTHTFGAARLVVARSLDEVADVVAGTTGPIRALGTRHSFHDLADTAGTLVTLVEVPPDPELDEAAHTVTVSAGTRYGVLAEWLEERGWALHNLGSLPHISVAGATQTGTHGSGVGNGNLSTAVVGLEYLDASGSIVSVHRGELDLHALAVGLGAFGIITRITLAIQPTYEVQQDVHTGISWSALLDEPDTILAAAYSVSVFTRWGEPTLEQVWVKRRVERDPAPASGWMGGARLDVPTQLVGGDPNDLTEQGTPGPWLHRLPHFRLDGTPSNGDEIQTEYFVAREDAAEALTAVRALASRIDPLLMITELRTVAADGLWLSGAYGRDTLAIHFTWRNLPGPVAEVLPDIERALEPFAPRPHWGKWHAFDAGRIAAAYPRLADARAVFAERDPKGRFANDHLHRLAVR
ncbi:MAG: FAD-binding protein [Demequina sp.]|jgi:xylitol oxidase|nr:FAD-binding protein [Demequina sp.]